MLQEATDFEDDMLRLVVLGAFDDHASVLYKGAVVSSPFPGADPDQYAEQARSIRETSGAWVDSESTTRALASAGSSAALCPTPVAGGAAGWSARWFTSSGFSVLRSRVQAAPGMLPSRTPADADRQAAEFAAHPSRTVSMSVDAAAALRARLSSSPLAHLAAGGAAPSAVDVCIGEDGFGAWRPLSGFRQPDPFGPADAAPDAERAASPRGAGWRSPGFRPGVAARFLRTLNYNSDGRPDASLAPCEEDVASPDSLAATAVFRIAAAINAGAWSPESPAVMRRLLDEAGLPVHWLGVLRSCIAPSGPRTILRGMMVAEAAADLVEAASRRAIWTGVQRLREELEGLGPAGDEEARAAAVAAATCAGAPLWATARGNQVPHTPDTRSAAAAAASARGRRLFGDDEAGPELAETAAGAVVHSPLGRACGAEAGEDDIRISGIDAPRYRGAADAEDAAAEAALAEELRELQARMAADPTSALSDLAVPTPERADEEPAVANAKTSRVRGASRVPWSAICWLRRRADVARALVLNAVFGGQDLPLLVAPWAAPDEGAAAGAERDGPAREALFDALAGSWREEEPAVPASVFGEGTSLSAAMRAVASAVNSASPVGKGVEARPTFDQALDAVASVLLKGLASDVVSQQRLWEQVLPRAIARRFDSHGIAGREALAEPPGLGAPALGSAPAGVLQADLGRGVLYDALSVAGLRLCGSVETVNENASVADTLPSALPHRLSTWAFPGITGSGEAAGLGPDEDACGAVRSEAAALAASLGRHVGAVRALIPASAPLPFAVAIKECCASLLSPSALDLQKACRLPSSMLAATALELDVAVHGRGGSFGGTRWMLKKRAMIAIVEERNANRAGLDAQGIGESTPTPEAAAAEAAKAKAKPRATGDSFFGPDGHVPEWANDGLGRSQPFPSSAGAPNGFVPLDAPLVAGASFAGERDNGMAASSHCDLTRLFELRAPPVASAFIRAPPAHVMLCLQHRMLDATLAADAIGMSSMRGVAGPAILATSAERDPQSMAFRAAAGAALPVAPCELDAASGVFDLRQTQMHPGEGAGTAGAPVRAMDPHFARCLWSGAQQLALAGPVNPNTAQSSMHLSLADLAGSSGDWETAAWLLELSMRSLRSPRHSAVGATAAVLLRKARAFRAVGKERSNLSITTLCAQFYGFVPPPAPKSTDGCLAALRASRAAAADKSVSRVPVSLADRLTDFALAGSKDATQVSVAPLRDAMFEGRAVELGEACAALARTRTLDLDVDRSLVERVRACEGPLPAADREAMREHFKSITGKAIEWALAIAQAIDIRADELAISAPGTYGTANPCEGTPSVGADGEATVPPTTLKAAERAVALAAVSRSIPDAVDMGVLRRILASHALACSTAQGLQPPSFDKEVISLAEASLATRTALSARVCDQLAGTPWREADPATAPAAFLAGMLETNPPGASFTAMQMPFCHQPAPTGRFGTNPAGKRSQGGEEPLPLDSDACGMAMAAAANSAVPHSTRHSAMAASAFMELAATLLDSAGPLVAASRLNILLAAAASADGAFGASSSQALVPRLEIALLLARAASPRHSVALPHRSQLGFDPATLARRLVGEAEAVLQRIAAARPWDAQSPATARLRALRAAGAGPGGAAAALPPLAGSAEWLAASAADPSLRRWQFLALRSKCQECRAVLAATPLSAIAEARNAVLTLASRALDCTSDALAAFEAGAIPAAAASREELESTIADYPPVQSPADIPSKGSWSAEQLGDPEKLGKLFHGLRLARSPLGAGTLGVVDEAGLLGSRAALAHEELARALRFAADECRTGGGGSGDGDASTRAAASRAYLQAALFAAHSALSLAAASLQSGHSTKEVALRHPAQASAAALVMSILLELDAAGAPLEDPHNALFALTGTPAAALTAASSADSLLGAALAVSEAAKPSWHCVTAAIERMMLRTGSTRIWNPRLSTFAALALAGDSLFATALALWRNAAGGFLFERKRSPEAPDVPEAVAASGLHALCNNTRRSSPYPVEDSGQISSAFFGTRRDSGVRGEASPLPLVSLRVVMASLFKAVSPFLAEDAAASLVGPLLTMEVVAGGFHFAYSVPESVRAAPAAMTDGLFEAAAAAAAQAAAATAPDAELAASDAGAGAAAGAAAAAAASAGAASGAGAHSAAPPRPPQRKAEAEAEAEAAAAGACSDEAGGLADGAAARLAALGSVLSTVSALAAAAAVTTAPLDSTVGILPGVGILDVAATCNAASSGAAARGVMRAGSASPELRLPAALAGKDGVTLHDAVSAARAWQTSLRHSTGALVCALQHQTNIIKDARLVRASLICASVAASLGGKPTAIMSGDVASVVFSVLPHEVEDLAPVDRVDTTKDFPLAPADAFRAHVLLRSLIGAHTGAETSMSVHPRAADMLKSRSAAVLKAAGAMRVEMRFIDGYEGIDFAVSFRPGPLTPDVRKQSLIAMLVLAARPLNDQLYGGALLTFAPGTGFVLRMNVQPSQQPSPMEITRRLLRVLTSAHATSVIVGRIESGSIASVEDLFREMRKLPSVFVPPGFGPALAWPLFDKMLCHPSAEGSVASTAGFISDFTSPKLRALRVDKEMVRFALAAGMDPSANRLEPGSSDVRSRTFGMGWIYPGNATMTISHIPRHQTVHVVCDAVPVPPGDDPRHLVAAFAIASQINGSHPNLCECYIGLRRVPSGGGVLYVGGVMPVQGPDGIIKNTVSEVRTLADGLSSAFAEAMSAIREGAPMPPQASLELDAEATPGALFAVAQGELMGETQAVMAGVLSPPTLADAQVGLVRGEALLADASANTPGKWLELQAAVLRLYSSVRAVIGPESRPGASGPRAPSSMVAAAAAAAAAADGGALPDRFARLTFAKASNLSDAGLHAWWTACPPEENGTPLRRPVCARGAVLSKAAVASLAPRHRMALRFMAKTVRNMLEESVVGISRLDLCDPEFAEACFMLGEALQEPWFQGVAVFAFVTAGCRPGLPLASEVEAAAEASCPFDWPAAAELQGLTRFKPIRGVGEVVGPALRAREEAMAAAARRCLGVPLLEWLIRCSGEALGWNIPPPTPFSGPSAVSWAEAQAHSGEGSRHPVFGSLACPVVLCGAVAGLLAAEAREGPTSKSWLLASGFPSLLAASSGIDKAGEAALQAARAAMVAACGSKTGPDLNAAGLEACPPARLAEAIDAPWLLGNAVSGPRVSELTGMQLLGRLASDAQSSACVAVGPLPAEGVDIKAFAEARFAVSTGAADWPADMATVTLPEAVVAQAVRRAGALMPSNLVLPSDGDSAEPSTSTAALNASVSSPDDGDDEAANRLRRMVRAEARSAQAMQSDLLAVAAVSNVLMISLLGEMTSEPLSADALARLCRQVVLRALVHGSHGAVLATQLLTTVFCERGRAAVAAAALVELEAEALQPAARLFVRDAVEASLAAGDSPREAARVGAAAASLTGGSQGLYAFLFAAQGGTAVQGQPALSATLRRWGGIAPCRDLGSLLQRRALECGDVDDRAAALICAAALGHAGGGFGAAGTAVTGDCVATADIASRASSLASLTAPASGLTKAGDLLFRIAPLITVERARAGVATVPLSDAATPTAPDTASLPTSGSASGGGGGSVDAVMAVLDPLLRPRAAATAVGMASIADAGTGAAADAAGGEAAAEYERTALAAVQAVPRSVLMAVSPMAQLPVGPSDRVRAAVAIRASPRAMGLGLSMMVAIDSRCSSTGTTILAEQDPGLRWERLCDTSSLISRLQAEGRAAFGAMPEREGSTLAKFRLPSEIPEGQQLGDDVFGGMSLDASAAIHTAVLQLWASCWGSFIIPSACLSSQAKPAAAAFVALLDPTMRPSVAALENICMELTGGMGATCQRVALAVAELPSVVPPAVARGHPLRPHRIAARPGLGHPSALSPLIVEGRPDGQNSADVVPDRGQLRTLVAGVAGSLLVAAELNMAAATPAPCRLASIMVATATLLMAPVGPFAGVADAEVLAPLVRSGAVEAVAASVGATLLSSNVDPATHVLALLLESLPRLLDAGLVPADRALQALRFARLTATRPLFLATLAHEGSTPDSGRVDAAHAALALASLFPEGSAAPAAAGGAASADIFADRACLPSVSVFSVPRPRNGPAAAGAALTAGGTAWQETTMAGKRAAVAAASALQATPEHLATITAAAWRHLRACPVAAAAVRSAVRIAFDAGAMNTVQPPSFLAASIRSPAATKVLEALLGREGLAGLATDALLSLAGGAYGALGSSDVCLAEAFVGALGFHAALKAGGPGWKEAAAALAGGADADGVRSAFAGAAFGLE
ncbi:hypothetical protein FNF31_05550 [Cafeteria roenbergensis]|uniref:Uncharacterized protein n=1 Tax=Cafeteria roenbergensis TaxID=33653 RepID=A0A5A8CYW8_CAFRO|nr:hypothetical protein FNF31_05550 [Cafeteria roenbergensis]KAA0160601.1 hypothetical protein FNF28_05399 [Cafeteria roenbergensis]